MKERSTRATWLLDDEDVGWDITNGWCLADCALAVELVAPVGQLPAPTGQFDPSVLVLLGFTERDVRGRPIWAVLDALDVNWVVIDTEFCTITTRDGVEVAAMQWDPLVDYPNADASTVAARVGRRPVGHALRRDRDHRDELHRARLRPWSATAGEAQVP